MRSFIQNWQSTKSSLCTDWISSALPRWWSQDAATQESMFFLVVAFPYVLNCSAFLRCQGVSFSWVSKTSPSLPYSPFEVEGTLLFSFAFLNHGVPFFSICLHLLRGCSSWASGQPRGGRGTSHGNGDTILPAALSGMLLMEVPGKPH